jgi:hypothetical protein
MKVTKITIGRLYNLGNYEHVRYDLTTEIPADGNAETAIIGMERILAGLKPLKNTSVKSASELVRQSDEVERMKTMNASEFHRHYGHCAGTPVEILERYQKSLEEETQRAQKAIDRSKMARQLFDDLGGAAQWKDAKLDWEDYNGWHED